MKASASTVGGLATRSPSVPKCVTAFVLLDRLLNSPSRSHAASRPGSNTAQPKRVPGLDSSSLYWKVRLIHTLQSSAHFVTRRLSSRRYATSQKVLLDKFKPGELSEELKQALDILFTLLHEPRMVIEFTLVVLDSRHVWWTARSHPITAICEHMGILRVISVRASSASVLRATS